MKLITSTVLILALLASAAQAGGTRPNPKHPKQFWQFQSLWNTGA